MRTRFSFPLSCCFYTTEQDGTVKARSATSWVWPTAAVLELSVWLQIKFSVALMSQHCFPSHRVSGRSTSLHKLGAHDCTMAIGGMSRPVWLLGMENENSMLCFRRSQILGSGPQHDTSHLFVFPMAMLYIFLFVAYQAFLKYWDVNITLFMLHISFLIFIYVLLFPS